MLSVPAVFIFAPLSWIALVLLRVAAVTVPVAVTFAPRMFPEKRALPCTERLLDGVVVPTPRFPAMYELPVVVAPPEIVRPAACVPAPMVLDANAVSLPVEVIPARPLLILRERRLALRLLSRNCVP